MANDGADRAPDTQSPTEQSVLIMIGQTLSVAAAATVSPQQLARRRNIFGVHHIDTPGSAPPITPYHDLRLADVSSRDIDSLTTATSLLMSPPRRRSRGAITVPPSTSTAAVTGSPRQGQDSKRARGTRPSAITDGLGWGRCTLNEFVTFSVGDQFIIVIPSDNRKKETKYAMDQRQNFRDRFVRAIGVLIHDRDKAHQHVSKHHGIERNNNECIEIRCSIQRYPYRDDYFRQVFSPKEVSLHIRQHGGLYVALYDYMGAAKTSNVVFLRWSEVPFIQVWTIYSRDDHRPPIVLNHDHGADDYVPELHRYYQLYKDDTNRLRELLLAHNRKKIDAVSKSNRALQRDYLLQQRTSEALTQSYLDNQYYLEMTDDRLPTFVQYADGLFYDAFVSHYSNFNCNVALLTDETMIAIHNQVEREFPMHYKALHSFMHGKRSHQPARSSPSYLLRKKLKVVHFFLTMIRERDRRHMIHWAMVTTIALHFKGVDDKCYRNTLDRASSADLKVSITKLNEIWAATADARTNKLKEQRFLMHSLDNYNRFQPFSLQRGGRSGLFHNGIVYNAALPNEFNKPVGTLLTNRVNCTIWKVITSDLSEDFHSCIVTAELVEIPTYAAEDVPIVDSASCLTALSLGMVENITLPSIDWKCIHIPGSSDSVCIDYVDQHIPSSLRQRIPVGIDDYTLVAGDRSWMVEKDSEVPFRSLDMRHYANLVAYSRRLSDLCFHMNHHLVNNTVLAGYSNAKGMIHHDVDKAEQFADSFCIKVLQSDSSLLSNISRFQLNFLEFFNEAYYAVTEYMWMPLLPRDEMQTEELYLAAIQILEEFGVLDASETNITPVPGFDWRRIFQYGDVLTIQKMHQLNPRILKSMTNIGRVNHAKNIHSMLNETCIRNHDYLHENIHRLQAVFKIYYPGFIEACARVLETKRVGIDPTEGRWKDHEDLTIKIMSALKRLRLDQYISESEMSSSGILDSSLSPSENLQRFMSKYDDYCSAMLSSTNEITRYVSRFLIMAEKWYQSKEAVRVADWALLEVESIDWLPVWGFVKKPQYQMEAMRRIEINYQLTAEELEYMRMGRFVRMHSNGNFMSFDDFCEKHNMALKQSLNNADIEVMCSKSRHLHAASRCAKLVLGYQGSSRSCATDAIDDIRALYLFFSNCHVFRNDGESSMKLADAIFMSHAVPDRYKNSASSMKKKIERQRHKPLSNLEKRHLLSHKGTDDGTDDDELSCEDEGSDAENYRSVPRVDVAEEFENNSVDGGGSICGSVGSTKDDKNRKPRKSTSLEKGGLVDVFSIGSVAVRNAIQNRLTKLNDEKVFHDTILASVNHFQRKVANDVACLKQRDTERSERIGRSEHEYESEVRQSLEKYFTDHVGYHPN